MSDADGVIVKMQMHCVLGCVAFEGKVMHVRDY